MAGVLEGKATVFATIDQTIAQEMFAVASNAVTMLTGRAPQGACEFLTLNRLKFEIRYKRQMTYTLCKSDKVYRIVI
jgi:hypothetical protein